MTFIRIFYIEFKKISFFQRILNLNLADMQKNIL